MSEGSDTNKTNKSCKCIICNCYYFLKVDFRFQSKNVMIDKIKYN